MENRMEMEMVEMSEAVKCSCCGEWVDKDDCRTVSGEIVCDDRIMEHYYYCEHCDKIIYEDDVVWYGDRCYCEDCADELFVECDDCGELMHRESGYTTANGHHICDDCRDNYIYCYCCDELYHLDDVYYDENIEEYFCYDCWQERQRREVIHGYNYKPAPIFYGEPHFVNWTNTTMYMGVELEIDKGGEYHEHAKAILDTVNATHEEHCYCKHDGSIYNGFEIVSHPATLEYHTNNIAWRELMQKALSMNYRSHDTDTCGLHIHISRNALGNTYDEQDNTIAKILYFVENNWYPIIKFTRRTENNLAHWANRYGVEKTEYPVQDTYDKAKSGYNRYKCINLQNSHTIEFRIFRGTLEHSTFIATLQFVNTLCSICKEISMDSVLYLDWYEFVSMIPETHTELIEYLKAKNLYALF